MEHTKETKKIVAEKYERAYEEGLALTRLLQDKYIRQYGKLESVQEQGRAVSEIYDLVRNLNALMEGFDN